MVSYKLANTLDSVRSRKYTWPMKLADIVLGLLALAIMGIAIYLGSKATPHTQQGCDHVSYLAGRCSE